MNKEALSKVKEAFEANKEVDVLFVTSDGQAFKKEQPAFVHGCSLKDSPPFVEMTKTIVNKLMKELDKEEEAEAKKLAEAKAKAKAEAEAAAAAAAKK